MKPYLFLLAILPFLSLTNHQDQRPNVIIILTDDQGSIDLNCYGATDLYTPNIDNLAKTGVKFDQFYAAAPLCSPSRAALLTGLNPHAAGLPNNASSYKGQKGMPTEKITMAEMMKSVGYATAHIGKWHLGFTPETMPNSQGFDYSYGHMGGCIDNYSHFFYWNGPNRHDLYRNGKEIYEDGKYFPDLMHQEAERFLKRNRKKPFFMYYAINLPHYPLQPTDKWRKHYKDLKHPRRDYAAFVSTIDERVGALMKTLKKLKLRKNTIIIFQSDHGHSVEQRAFGGGGSAGNLRGAKMSLFEGGIRVPAIINWKGKIPKNQTRNQVAYSIDWMPTIAELCGIKMPKVEGKSLVSVINNATEKSPHQVFRWKQGVSWAIRKGDWKLMGYPNDNTKKAKLNPEKDLLFLSNIKTDETEMTNLAAKFPEKVKELTQDYLTWEFAHPEDIPKAQKAQPSLAKGKSIELKHAPHRSYKGNGATSLIDEQLGTKVFRDGFWLGFQSKDLEAIIDLGKTQPIEGITIGALQNAGAWIFLPKFIEVSFSDDGKTYSKLIQENIEPVNDASRNFIQRITVQEENSHGRFIKIKIKNTAKCLDWHTAKGQPAWLFVDEILVY